MKFTITSGPHSHGDSTRYARNAGLSIGDVVEVPDPDNIDSDGDVKIAHENGEFRAYIARACLTPAVGSESGVVQISAVRAALVALGIEADVVAVAQAIEKEIAR